jgi:hypothetical protein
MGNVNACVRPGDLIVASGMYKNHRRKFGFNSGIVLSSEQNCSDPWALVLLSNGILYRQRSNWIEFDGWDIVSET